MEKIKLYIYGAGGHGKVVKDIALDNGYKEIIFIDDKSEFTFKDFINKVKSANVIVAIGNNFIRRQKQIFLENLNYNIVSLIHSSAIIGSNVIIENGVVIMPNVVINANSVIKKGVILNTSCVIEHDCIIEEFSHISPNVSLAGGVKVGKNTHIGIGCSVIENIVIGDNVIVGAGSVVIRNVDNNSKIIGVPAKKIKE